MIGAVLLLLSLLLYFPRKWRFISYFLYIGFLLDGYGIFISPLLGGIRNDDLALMYTVFVSLIMIITKKYSLPANSNVIKWYYIFIAFLICSVIYSYIHYAIPIFSIIQGGRLFFLILCVPILINIGLDDTRKLIYNFSIMTIIIGIIDFVQIIFQIPILPSYSIMIDSSTGLYRFFNYPIFTEFFLLICILYPNYYGKLTKYVIGLLIICLLGSFARSLMLITLLSVFLVLYFSKRASKIIKYALALSVFTIPMIPVIVQRFLNSNSEADIQMVMCGDIDIASYGYAEGTFVYRISWVLERFLYLIERPLSEQFFGLGLISDGSELSKQMYNFVVNIIFYDADNMVQQLRSPDIAYGTMLAYLGFGGMIIYLIFYSKLLMFFYREKMNEPYCLIIAVLMITGLLSSFFSDSLSNPSSLALYFMLMGVVLKNKTLLEK